MITRRKRELDPEAVERDGLQEVKCGRCGEVLAHQSRDGTELIPNAVSRIPTTSRVGLKCGCGGLTEWRRAANGKKAPHGKPALPRRA